MMKDIALKLLKADIATLPIMKNKKPAGGIKWRSVGKNDYSEQTIEQWYNCQHQGIAVLGGRISKGLTCVDFDLKNTDDKELFHKVFEQIQEIMPEFADWCSIVMTPSGGYHIYFQCDEIDGNLQLAKSSEGKVIIETRGEGGYAATYPTPGYELINGSIETLAIKVTPEEKEAILNICRSFNEFIDKGLERKNQKKSITSPERYLVNPFEDYNERVTSDQLYDLIKGAGFQFAFSRGQKDFYKRIGSENKYGANYHHGLNVFYPFTDNSLLQGGKGYTPAQLLIIVKFSGDGKQAYKWLIQGGFGHKIDAKSNTIINQIKEQLKNGEPAENILFKMEVEQGIQNVLPMIEVAQRRISNEDETFWEETEDSIKIYKRKLVEWFESRNYALLILDESAKNNELVKLDPETKTIKLVETVHLKQDLLQWIRENDLEEHFKNQLTEKLIGLTSTFFNEKVYEWMRVLYLGKDIIIKRDSPTESYFFFQNGVLTISKTGVTLIPYTKLPDKEYIWENEVKPYDMKMLDMTIMDHLNSCEWFIFIKRLCNLGPDTDNLELEDLFLKKPEQTERLLAFMTTIGYLCHNYNDPSKSFAVIIAEDISDSSLGGGTGKGILAKSFRYIRPGLIKPGKNWDPSNEFAFNNWNESIRYMIIEDIERKFKFELMYNTITDGLDLRKLYKGTVYVSFDNLPKFIFTTNYGDIAAGTQHGERRRKMLLVGNYFGPNKTPRDEFGHDLFKGWDKRQWILFYNFMAECTHVFFTNGLQDFPESDNMAYKTYIGKYGEELFDFFTNIQDWDWSFPRLLKDLRDEFKNQYPDRKVSAQYFSSAFTSFCNLFNLEVKELKGTDRGTLNRKMVHLVIRSLNGSYTPSDTPF